MFFDWYMYMYTLHPLFLEKNNSLNNYDVYDFILLESDNAWMLLHWLCITVAKEKQVDLEITNNIYILYKSNVLSAQQGR